MFPRRVTFWKHLILMFLLERLVHLLSFITLFLVTTTTSWPSQKQDLNLPRRALMQPKETSAYISWHSVVIQREKQIIILRNNDFMFQPIPSDYYNTTRDQCGQYVCWKQDSWHSLSTILECKSRLIPYHYNNIVIILLSLSSSYFKFLFFYIS